MVRRQPSETDAAGQAQTTPGQPRSVRIPGFLPDEPVGLGDVVKRATSLVGIKPCGGCAQRAAMLNSRVQFTGWKR
jgi:hypothetical protein